MSSLQARLQNPDYINWVKAGLCLIHTKSGLDDFADTASQSLHQSILTNIIPTFANIAQPVCGISLRRHNLITICAHPYCQGFLAAVIIKGIDPIHPFTVRPGNLANCDVGQWHNNHWEVAKLFMNQGQLPTQVNPSETDLKGIVNFLSHCKVPRNMVTNVFLLDEVRKARNDIMHTADMKLSNADLHTYSQAMIDLLNDPGIACFPTAQLALADIQSIINSVEFQITLKGERKVIDEQAAEIRAMTEGMKSILEAVAECGEADRQAIKEQLNEEIKKEKDGASEKDGESVVSETGEHSSGTTSPSFNFATSITLLSLASPNENSFEDLYSLDFQTHPEKLSVNITPSGLAEYIRKAGRSSTEIKHFIQWLDIIIKRSLNGIQRLWVGYKPQKDEPVFVAMVDELKDDFPTQVMNFEIIQRVNGQVSDEAKFVLLKEIENDLTFSAEEQASISSCLAKYSTKLMRDHSNLTVVSASKIKSVNHGREDALYAETMCIALYVDAKGVVPIHEELLPTQLDEIPVDVREGTFKTYGKKPSDYHEKLLMGCQIVTDYKTCGTLGGFIQIENNKLACLTCCHVFVTPESISDLKRDDALKKGVYQPCPAEPECPADPKIGQLVKWLRYPGDENNIGVDAALIEISNPLRYPESGYFPDAESYLAGFSPENPMRFDSGEVVKCIHEVPIPSIVVKYGATTGHTFGTVRLFGPAVHAHTTSFIPEQDKVQLHQQLEVFSPSPSDLKFSDEGDSGSLVFLQSNQNIRALGLLVGGTTYGTTIVTPMWAVLSKLDLPLQLLNFASGPCMLPPRNLTLDNVVKDVENLKSNVLELVGHAQQTDQKMSELVEHANQTDQKMSELVEHANQTDQKMSELVEHAHQTDQKMKIIEGKIDQVGNNIDGKLERQHAEVIALLTNRSNNN